MLLDPPSTEAPALPVQRRMLALACAAWLASAGAAWALEADGRAEDPPASPAANAGDFDQEFLAARELAWSGQREQALAAFSALLERSPGNSDVLLARGRLYAWMKEWAEAEVDLRAATVRSPTYADAWSALGDMYLWSDRPSQAARAYGQWLALSPDDDPAPLIARGRAERAAGNVAAARADFSAARSRGADTTQIDEYIASLTPRALNPGALSPEVVVPAGDLWSASFGLGWTGFSSSRADWGDSSASIRRHFEQGSLALEVLGIDRFGSSDHAWALDGYVDLWDRGYANLRYQHGPQENLFPSAGWWVELFQGAGQGWELSAGVAHLDFSPTQVDLYSLGLGKYVGNWYLRLRHLYVPGDDKPSNSDRVLVRYYYKGDADNYFEMSGGFGRSEQPLLNNPDASGSSYTWSAGTAFVWFPSRRWGFKLGAGFGREDGGYYERTAFGSLYTRW